MSNNPHERLGSLACHLTKSGGIGVEIQVIVDKHCTLRLSVPDAFLTELNDFMIKVETVQGLLKKQ